MFNETQISETNNLNTLKGTIGALWGHYRPSGINAGLIPLPWNAVPLDTPLLAARLFILFQERQIENQKRQTQMEPAFFDSDFPDSIHIVTGIHRRN